MIKPLELTNFSAFAGGQVFYSRPGFVGFPVKLAIEIFEKSMSLLKENSVSDRLVLYDPCCGSGQLLTTLGFLYGDTLAEIIGSDINSQAVELAQKNLGLLSEKGINERIEDLRVLATKFNKESHMESLQYAIEFKEQLKEMQTDHEIKTKIFNADCTNSQDLENNLKDTKIDLVITDVPYGLETSWQVKDSELPGNVMMEALKPFLTKRSVVAVVTNRQQKIENPHYQKIAQIKAAKRRVLFFRLLG